MIEKINLEKVKQLEYLLLFENNPLSLEEIYKVLKSDKKELDSIIEYCNNNYQKVGSIYRILFFDEDLFLSINSEDKEIIEKIKPQKVRKVNKATMEVLSIIAYEQPITRLEIEEIRGVNSTSHIKLLLEDELIETAGQKDTIGKPMMYKTTAKFLLHFGIQSLKDLPPLEDIKNYEFLEE